MSHQALVDECPGCLFPIAKEGGKDVRRICSVCGSKTASICSLCRLPFCSVNRDEKIKKAIEKSAPSVAFMKGKRPAAFIEIVTTEGKKLKVENTCFHMRHQKKMDEVSKQFGAGYKRPSSS